MVKTDPFCHGIGYGKLLLRCSIGYVDVVVIIYVVGDINGSYNIDDLHFQ